MAEAPGVAEVTCNGSESPAHPCKLSKLPSMPVMGCHLLHDGGDSTGPQQPQPSPPHLKCTVSVDVASNTLPRLILVDGALIGLKEQETLSEGSLSDVGKKRRERPCLESVDTSCRIIEREPEVLNPSGERRFPFQLVDLAIKVTSVQLPLLELTCCNVCSLSSEFRKSSLSINPSTTTSFDNEVQGITGLASLDFRSQVSAYCTCTVFPDSPCSLLAIVNSTQQQNASYYRKNEAAFFAEACTAS
eukprot:584320-Hanusia_phi.AAC.2